MRGTILFWKANLITDNLGINALAYALPVLSLVWLAAVGEIWVVRVNQLLVGMVLILGGICLNISSWVGGQHCGRDSCLDFWIDCLGLRFLVHLATVKYAN